MEIEDLDSVLALEEATFGDPWHREAFLAEIAGSPHVRWPLVAIGERGLAGYIVAWFISDETQVANLAVAPTKRRRGLARILLDRVLEEARARGCVHVHLEVRPSNTPARSLYRSFGFRPVGRRRHYYADTGEDALVMRLDLAPDLPHSG